MTKLADTSDHWLYMQRCISLAKKGRGYVAPNPMVGAVLVHNGRILSEGWHKCYGQAHAEVNCLEGVKKEDQPFISQSTLYVSLEPCAHHGKTPPCADLIIRHRIPKVVVGCVDIFAQVAGKGIEKLKNAGIEVLVDGPWNPDCIHLNRAFFNFHAHKRPYIILKWASTADNFIAPNLQPGASARLLISGATANRWVHKWRSEAAAILIGKNTALKDNPFLNNRLYAGPSPIKMVLDPHLQVSQQANLFKGTERVIVFNFVKSGNLARSEVRSAPIEYVQLEREKNLAHQITSYCYKAQIQSLFIEGGQRVLQTFLDSRLWDECRIITNTRLATGQGLPAPTFTDYELRRDIYLGADKISYFVPVKTTKDNVYPLEAS